MELPETQPGRLTIAETTDEISGDCCFALTVVQAEILLQVICDVVFGLFDIFLFDVVKAEGLSAAWPDIVTEVAVVPVSSTSNSR